MELHNESLQSNPPSGLPAEWHGVAGKSVSIIGFSTPSSSLWFIPIAIEKKLNKDFDFQMFRNGIPARPDFLPLDMAWQGFSIAKSGFKD